jgi:signal transduction protein with GAF and PtsI domain
MNSNLEKEITMGKIKVRKFYLYEFKAISRAISTYEDLNVLFNHIAEGLCRTFNSKGCIIMLLDEGEKQLYQVSSYGISDEYLNKGPVLVNDINCDFIDDKPIIIEDMQEDKRVQYPKAALEENISAMLSVPIKCRKSIIGIIRLYNKESIMLHKDDIDSICILSYQLGIVIENNGLKNFFEGVKSSMISLPPRMLKGL